MRTEAEIESAFTYHPPPGPAEVDFYNTFREDIKAEAFFLLRTLKDCPERTIALRHLEQAVMYANAAVARHGLQEHP